MESGELPVEVLVFGRNAGISVSHCKCLLFSKSISKEGEKREEKGGRRGKTERKRPSAVPKGQRALKSAIKIFLEKFTFTVFICLP